MTALHLAARAGHGDVVKYLALLSGADINDKVRMMEDDMRITPVC